MNTKKLIFPVILLVIVIAGGAYLGTKKSAPPVQSHSSVSAASHDAAMVSLLKAQTGDAYDAMFITMMSEHHAGAIAMAQMVDTEATHPEVRALAKQIIAAQSKELADMKTWAGQWGYTYSEPSHKAVMAMSAGMNGMHGDNLDHQFLTDMIGHHNAALDMAMLSADRAQHSEIKTLSANILSTQTTEIALMKQLSAQYGYSTAEAETDHSSMMMH